MPLSRRLVTPYAASHAVRWSILDGDPAYCAFHNVKFRTQQGHLSAQPLVEMLIRQDAELRQGFASILIVDQKHLNAVSKDMRWNCNA